MRKLGVSAGASRAARRRPRRLRARRPARRRDRAPARRPGPYDVILCFCPDSAPAARPLAGAAPADDAAPARCGSRGRSGPPASPTDLDENVIREYALANGRVDVKVCAVDDVWSGPQERDPQGGPVIIPARFNGPPGSGNGGYCGRRCSRARPARRASVEVTLRRPPPLDTRADRRAGRPRAPVSDGDGWSPRSRRSDAFDAAVPPVPLAEAAAASPVVPRLRRPPVPDLLRLRPRARRDGLRIFPGRLPDGRTAAPCAGAGRRRRRRRCGPRWTAPAAGR